MAICYEMLFQPLESIRRWELLCPCHAKERAQARQSGGRNEFRECPWNSRRLRQAAPKVKAVVAELRERANKLTAADCEGDGRVCTAVINAIRACASELELRFKYLCVLPWSLSRADEREGAALCLEQ